MGRHSQDYADQQWIDILHTAKKDSGLENVLPIPASYFVGDAEWTTRHAEPSLSLVAYWQVWAMIACLIDAVIELASPSLVAIPARRARRPLVSSLVIACRRACGRVTDAARTLKQRLSSRDRRAFSLSAAVTRHALILALLMSLTQPTPLALPKKRIPHAVVQPW